MSDPVIKGAKRSTPRPAPHGASPKSSAKSRKLTADSARPKPINRHSGAEKAPVRKATPTKTTSTGTAGKTSRPPAKQAKAAPPAKKSTSKARSATPSKAPAPSKAKVAAKPQPKKNVPVPETKGRASRPAPATKQSAKPEAAVPRQPTGDEAAALKAFERAHKEFTRGRFADARNLFRTLIEQHAGVAEVTARARTYLAIAEARLRTEAALPRDAESLYDRGVIELNRGEYVAAQEMFERAVKREPEAADSHYALAATRARLGSIESALQSLARALELRPVLRVRAQHDPDLASLRNEPDYERLIFSAPRS